MLSCYRKALHHFSSNTYYIYASVPSVGMPNRRACDRCHKFKEKCDFDNQATKCTLCQRSKSVCTTTRLEVRQGRRPKAKSLGPFVSVQVWDLDSTQSLPISPNERSGCIENTRQQASLGEPDEEHQNSSLTSYGKHNWLTPSSATPPLPPAKGLDSSLDSEQPQKLDEHLHKATEEPFYPSSSS
jgi:hypothetical protein